MDEFLEKLREDQRRMRKFLRANGPRFKQMGDVLAEVAVARARLFLVGEPPLDALMRLIAEDYLTHLPALPVDLTRPTPPSTDPDESGEPAVGRQAAARQVARHLHKGDAVLAFVGEGDDRDTRIVLEAARARRVPLLVIGGLDARQRTRQMARVALTLPTRGVKTLCESTFVCARILGRIARARVRERTGADEERLVQASCETCCERVFFAEEQRGRRARCPLCQASTRVPADAGRRAVLQVAPVVYEADEPEARTGRRPPRPSVLEVPAVDPRDLEGPGSPPSDDLVDDERTTPASRSRPPAPGGSALVAATAEDPSGEGPTFGSEIVVGSGQGGASGEGPDPAPRAPASAAPAPLEEDAEDEGEEEAPRERRQGRGGRRPPRRPEPSPAVTASADPFALPDGFLGDLEMPRDRADSDSAAGASASDSAPPGDSRLVSARYTIAECKLRWGRGGYPDESGPENELITLSPGRLVFLLDPDDEAAAILTKGDELWLRIDVPAFLEPVLVRGTVTELTGSSGSGRRGTRAELALESSDPQVSRKLARAAENMGAPA